MRERNINKYGQGKKIVIRLHKTAFTLIELLVVVCIISLLVGILVPALSKIKQKVRALVSANNQKQIAAGVFCYSADQKNQFPDSVAKLGKRCQLELA